MQSVPAPSTHLRLHRELVLCWFSNNGAQLATGFGVKKDLTLNPSFFTGKPCGLTQKTCEPPCVSVCSSVDWGTIVCLLIVRINEVMHGGLQYRNKHKLIICHPCAPKDFHQSIPTQVLSGSRDSTCWTSGWVTHADGGRA